VRRRRLPPLLLPIGVAFACALPSLGPGFIHDDHRIIEQNQLVQEAGRLPEILARGYWTVDERQVPNLYRPVTILSFALNHRVTGEGAFGFRLVDLLLHLLVVGLVYGVARRMIPEGGPRGAAGGPGPPAAPVAAALLFAAHPVHTEALGLVVGRSEILMALFTLLALRLFLDGKRAAALLMLPCALFSKESGIAAPLLLLAADRLRPTPHAGTAPVAAGGRRRVAWGFHGAACGIAIACVAIRAVVLGGVLPSSFTHFVDNPIAHQPWPGSLFTALAALARYAALLVWPSRLSIDYSFASIPDAASILDPRALAGALVAAGVAYALARSWRRSPAVAFALLLFALPLLPVANLFFPIGTILAERLLYLPSAGVCLLAGIGFGRLEERAATPGRRRLILAAVAVITAVLALRSAWRFRDWRDDRTIFAAAVSLFPDNVRAQFNYGAASERARDDAGAEQAYRRALAVWPRFSDARYNLAGLYGRAGHWREAAEEYRAALTEQPGNVTYLVNAGHAAAQAGDPRAAIELLERAVDLDRSSGPGWTDLGAARLQIGDAAGALAAFREADRLAPGRPEAAANIALALEAAGQAPEAAAAWRAAADGKPGDPLLRYRLGRALESAGRPDEAIEAYRDSIRLAPDTPVPLKALGLLLASRGRNDEARAALERARRLDPSGRVMDDAAIRVLERLPGSPGARVPSPAPPAPGDAPGRN